MVIPPKFDLLCRVEFIAQLLRYAINADGAKNFQFLPMHSLHFNMTVLHLATDLQLPVLEVLFITKYQPVIWKQKQILLTRFFFKLC